MANYYLVDYESVHQDERVDFELRRYEVYVSFDEKEWDGPYEYDSIESLNLSLKSLCEYLGLNIDYDYIRIVDSLENRIFGPPREKRNEVILQGNIKFVLDILGG